MGFAVPRLAGVSRGLLQLVERNEQHRAVLRGRDTFRRFRLRCWQSRHHIRDDFADASGFFTTISSLAMTARATAFFDDFAIFGSFLSVNTGGMSPTWFPGARERAGKEGASVGGRARPARVVERGWISSPAS
jgi:hypothetical protein